MPEPTGTFTLLPWVRQGVTTGSLPVDTLADTLKARVSLDVGVRVNSDTVGVKARLYGPGDVVGIDSKLVARTDPRPRSADVEAKYLAGIEFARADFPWLFTPAAADGQDRLRPWRTRFGHPTIHSRQNARDRHRLAVRGSVGIRVLRFERGQL